MKKYVLIIYVLIFAITGCKVGSLTAVDGSVLNITANPSVVAPGGSCEIKVVGFKPSGSPLPDGTVIFFSANIGTIPASGKIKEGYVTVIYSAPAGKSGTATIEASSGMTSDNQANKVETSVLIGSTAVKNVEVSSSPGSLPPQGGRVVLSVLLKDENFNPVPGVSVTFSADRGYLSCSNPVSDSNGRVEAILDITETTTVTVYAGSISGTVNIAVKDNSSPVADFTFSPTSPKVGEAVYVNGYGSSDSDGYIKKYHWEFGDGARGTGVSTSHIYSKDGTYNITLVVEDNYGLQSSKTVAVTITNGDSPIAAFTANPQGSKKVAFDASLSTDKDDNIIKYEWSFGDGTNGSGLAVTHTYATTGTFTVVLKVTDEKGNTGTAQQSVVVN